MKIRLDSYSFVSAIKAALLFSAKNNVRYYLNGVHLVSCDGGFYLESTDGYKAMRVKIDRELPREFDVILPLDLCVSIAKIRIPKKERSMGVLDLVIDGISIEVCHDTVTYTGVSVDGKFPDIGRVMVKPTSESFEDRGVNAEYLIEAGKAIHILANPNPKYHGASLCGGQGSRDVFYFEVLTNHGDFTEISEPATFVVMPMRL